uniref:Uncharacterized protein n=1 Tax=Pyrodinium bahamense TaxID=73915 RepID=A0A7S0AXM0_9DINO|mmetsp:Transcript_43895/g.122051  ORF Transcript_43895/g.122051 Transcript_43895/m.122051 type:complete len:135 (+) Transcript_43895:536-940(+)
MIINSRALENLEVRGAEYPPPADKVMAAQVVFYIQMALFGFVFMGENLFSAMKMAVPPLVAQVKENMFASFMFIWLVGNMIQGSLLSTGAFEIYHGNQLIWSSLQEKRLPNMEDLIKAFQKSGVEFMTSHQDGS